jgi:hypothetical protein
MAYVSREQILNADDLKTETVAVPEWGGDVLVRGLTAKERDDYEASLMSQQSGKSPTLKYDNIRAKLVQKSIVDPVDMKTPVFTVADIEALGKKSGQAIDRIFGVAQRLSGITQADTDELEKNS